MVRILQIFPQTGQSSICFLLIRRKSVLNVQFVFLLIRSISLEAIFIVVPRLALHDLIFLFTRIINQSFAFSPD